MLPPNLLRIEGPELIYEVEFIPTDRKLVWHQVAEELPPISPSEPETAQDTSRGEIVSEEQPIVADPPGAEPGSQFIWQPPPVVEVNRDFPLPNMIATAAPDLPAPPPRPFIPPEPTPVEVASTPLVPPPGLDLPPPTVEIPTLEWPTGHLDVAGPPPRPFVPPAGTPRGSPEPSIVTEAPPVIRTESAQGGLAAAVVGLNPVQGMEVTLPPVSRNAKFSRGRVPGDPDTGSGGGRSGIPGLAIGGGSGGTTAGGGPVIVGTAERGGGPSPNVGESPEEIGRDWVRYDETLLPPSMATLSVPLRPSNRTLPWYIERKFQNRLVYTLVVPMVNMRNYSGDWILWFAEREQHTGDTARMRAPVPLAKREPIPADGVTNGLAVEGRVQLVAVIDGEGRVESAALFKGDDVQLSHSALEDFRRWRFRPASRNGNAVAVEVIVEIPFRGSFGLADGTGPPD